MSRINTDDERVCRLLVSERALAFDPANVLDEWTCCECCGEWTNSPEMHHRQFRSRLGLWIPSNIVLLCPRCHWNVTHESPLVAGKGLAVQSWEDPHLVPVQLWHTDTPVYLDDLGGWQVDPPAKQVDDG